nr:neuropeptide-like protein 30 [Hydra vulgaris]XP_047135444.1 neuropeptide-like protein 30 [Hydra vulgaris]
MVSSNILLSVFLYFCVYARCGTIRVPSNNGYGYGYSGYGGYSGELNNKGNGYGGYGGYSGGLNNKLYGYGNSYYNDKSIKDTEEDPSYNSYSKTPKSNTCLLSNNERI